MLKVISAYKVQWGPSLGEEILCLLLRDQVAVSDLNEQVEHSRNVRWLLCCSSITMAAKLGCMRWVPCTGDFQLNDGKLVDVEQGVRVGREKMVHKMNMWCG